MWKTSPQHLASHSHGIHAGKRSSPEAFRSCFGELRPIFERLQADISFMVPREHNRTEHTMKSPVRCLHPTTANAMRMVHVDARGGQQTYLKKSKETYNRKCEENFKFLQRPVGDIGKGAKQSDFSFAIMRFMLRRQATAEWLMVGQTDRFCGDTFRLCTP